MGATLRMVRNLVPAGLIDMAGATMGERGLHAHRSRRSIRAVQALDPASGLTAFTLLNEPRNRGAHATSTAESKRKEDNREATATRPN
jgi:hypothetical protein